MTQQPVASALYVDCDPQIKDELLRMKVDTKRTLTDLVDEALRLLLLTHDRKIPLRQDLQMTMEDEDNDAKQEKQ